MAALGMERRARAEETRVEHKIIAEWKDSINSYIYSTLSCAGYLSMDIGRRLTQGLHIKIESCTIYLHHRVFSKHRICLCLCHSGTYSFLPLLGDLPAVLKCFLTTYKHSHTRNTHSRNSIKANYS